MSSLITRRYRSPTARTVRLTYRCRALAWMDPRRDGRIRGPAHLCLTTTEAGSNLLALCERVGDHTPLLGRDKGLGRGGPPAGSAADALSHALRHGAEIGRAHVRTPVTRSARMP